MNQKVGTFFGCQFDSLWKEFETGERESWYSYSLEFLIFWPLTDCCLLGVYNLQFDALGGCSWDGENLLLGAYTGKFHSMVLQCWTFIAGLRVTYRLFCVSFLFCFWTYFSILFFIPSLRIYIYIYSHEFFYLFNNLLQWQMKVAISVTAMYHSK